MALSQTSVVSIFPFSSPYALYKEYIEYEYDGVCNYIRVCNPQNSLLIAGHDVFSLIYILKQTHEDTKYSSPITEQTPRCYLWW